MSSRAILLLLTPIVPKMGAIALSSFYLFSEWTALEHAVVRRRLRAYRNDEPLSRTKAETRTLSIAQSAEVRHRIHCFAERVGVLLGGVVVAIGIQGLCLLPDKKSN
ncbi:MAG TPA: hypothetical protein VL134_04285 [Leptolyngbya sp.]|jgi:hypothetical protein|nr:hypothetical protein [Leptolyngbya sp.]